MSRREATGRPCISCRLHSTRHMICVWCRLDPDRARVRNHFNGEPAFRYGVYHWVILKVEALASELKRHSEAPPLYRKD